MYNKEKEEAYYLLSLHDLYEGIEIEALEAAIEDMELLEEYEACRGIQRAIKFAKENTKQAIQEEYDNELDRLAEEVD
jgi:hypothetical protein|tara:strand:- start:397 stop:630 length:234 start_codon:yes stop_codon:yes gene_type:complete